MPSTVGYNQTLTSIGITVADQQVIVGGDFIPASNLADESESGIIEAYSSYQRIYQAEDCFRLSRIVIERLVALIYWVKGRIRTS